MRKLFLRILILSMLLFSIALPSTFLAQDNPTVTVSPSAGVVGSGIFEVTASELIAGDIYTIEFVINGVIVYESDEEADAEGQIVFSAASTPEDEIGVYTVQVISNDSIIASTTLEITEEASNDTNGNIDGTVTEAIGNLSVTPQSGPISTVHDIAIRDLDPEQGYTVEITATETEEVVYRRIWTSSETGAIDIEIFAEDGDTAGQQVVRVFDNDGMSSHKNDFVIEAPPERNANVAVSPLVTQAGREVTITVDGLAPFDSVSVQVTSDDNLLIDTLLARASSEGIAILSFLSDDELEDDSYNIAVFVDGDRLASSTLTIGDADAVITENNTTEDSESTSDVSLLIEPELGPIGSVHVMNISGLDADQAFTFTILDRDGNIEYSTTRTADANGDFSINITSSEGDELGRYSVEISNASSGQVLTSAEMLITATDSPPQTDETTSDATDNAQTGDLAISVSPQSGEIGTTHTITLSGMPANERIGITIRYASDETLAQSSVATIDEDGNGILSFTSRDLNILVNIKLLPFQPEGTITEAFFTIEGAIATIEPQSGALGSTHEITVNGLKRK